MKEDPKIVDAVAEWDDREQLFRVYLFRDSTPKDCSDPNCDGDCADEMPPEPEPLNAVHFDPAWEARLYKAVFCANPKDFKGLKAGDALGWSKRAPAERAAKAVKRELARIEKGAPGPTDYDVQFALLGVKRK